MRVYREGELTYKAEWVSLVQYADWSEQLSEVELMFE